MNQFDSKKLLYHTERVLMYLKKGITFPIVMEISPSGICNQDCYYCVNKNYRNNQMLSKEDIIKIIDEISKFALAITITGGGEPLLNENTYFLIEYAKKNNLSVGLISNGQNINFKKLSNVLSYLSFFRISIDSVDESYFLISKGQFSNYQVTIQNINKIAQIKNKNNKLKLLFGIHIVWINQSDFNIEKTIKFFIKPGIDFIQIRPVDYTSNNKINHIDYTKKKGFIDNLKKKYGSNPTTSIIFSKDKFDEIFKGITYKAYKGCPGGNFTAAIGSDMNVYFCCNHFYNKKYILGNFKKNTINDIFLSDIRKNFIKNCNHFDCHKQCRNNVINKLLFEIQKNKHNSYLLINEYSKKEKPLHYEFL